MDVFESLEALLPATVFEELYESFEGVFSDASLEVVVELFEGLPPEGVVEVLLALLFEVPLVLSFKKRVDSYKFLLQLPEFPQSFWLFLLLSLQLLLRPLFV